MARLFALWVRSSNSRRQLPIRRSIIEFICGARTAGRTILVVGAALISIDDLADREDRAA